jgi:hypothetical protein
MKSLVDTINDKILNKIKELTDDKNEFLMCKRILEQENLYQNDDEWDYRTQFKSYLNEYFPFNEE